MTRILSLIALVMLPHGLAIAQQPAATPGAAATPPATPPAAVIPGAPTGAADVLDVMFRPNKKFFTVGEPIEVGVMLENRGKTPFPTKGIALDPDLVLRDRSGKTFEKKGTVEGEGASMPATLGPGERGIRTIDLRAAFPDLSAPGCYIAEWKNPRVRSRCPEIRISTPYDPTKEYEATLHTTKGDITIALDRAKAPNHVFNFVQLSTAKYYDGVTFHRVKAGAFIHGGDPNGDGSGNAGYMVKAEPNDLKHERGSLVMSRGTDVNSASAQFYICLAPQPELDGKYTVFGKVTSGIEAADAIGKTPAGPGDKPTEPMTITSVSIKEHAGATPAGAAPAATPTPTPTPTPTAPAAPKVP